MGYSASFLFHGSLNDFLTHQRKALWFTYFLKTPASLKDSIEAIGVPHVEVRQVLVNGEASSIDGLMGAGEKVEVFPFEHHSPPAAPRNFVLDGHLGKLARLLRMLGMDTIYKNDLSDRDITAIAVAQQRTVLTRDVGLLKHKVLKHGYWLRSQQPGEQVIEVARYFSLCSALQPFSRCLSCNGNIEKVEKENVQSNLPEQTNRYFREFFQCQDCKKIYWKGSHYENMQDLVERVRSLAC